MTVSAQFTSYASTSCPKNIFDRSPSRKARLAPLGHRFSFRLAVVLRASRGMLRFVQGWTNPQLTYSIGGINYKL
eukprot:scaffold202619_cov35-Prasinocladus_malaysianus.AAC.1